MEESHEKLSDNVHQLIEAVSNLVVCTVTGEMGDIQTHCTSLAEYTNKVVLQAKDIAIAARNKETTEEITKCTNDITKEIERLINAFFSLVENFSNQEAKKNFAMTSKDVGLAINNLIIAADTAASRKVIEVCSNAKEIQQDLLRCVQGDSSELMRVARLFGQTSLHAESQGSSAATHSADPAKSSFLSHSVAQIKDSMKEFIRLAHTINSNPDDVENKNELAAQYRGLVRIFDDVIQAAEMKPDFSSNINDAFDRFNKMLDLANAVRNATNELYEGVLNGMSLEDFNKMAKNALQTTMNLIEQALKVLANETDPIRREQIQTSIDDTKASISKFIQSAKACQLNPNDPQLKKQMEASKNENDKQVTKLVALTSKGMEEEKLYYTCKFLENQSNEMMRDIEKLNQSDLQYYANRIQAITERVVKDARAVAVVTQDPQKRERILNGIVDLTKAGDRYVGDIKNLSRNPGDPQLIKRVGITHKMFGNQIYNLLIAAGLEDENNNPYADHSSSSADNDDNELVRAAKEQAQLALQIIKDAMLMAQQMDDNSQQKQQLLSAISRLKQYASDVINKAKECALDPNNLDKQIQLDEAQRLLADGIRDVIMLTSSVASELKSLMDSLADQDDIDISNVFELAERLINELKQFVDTIQQTSAKDVVLKAKNLATLTTQLSSMIRSIADKTPDPRYKEQLVGLSRFMRDRATQVKMIAAVKVACGGDAGQVSSAADGLRSTVTECVSTLKASELKRRRTRMAGRAAQIRKVIEMWQKSKSY